MEKANWQYKVGLMFLPVIDYAILMIGRRFPVSERVTAGVSFKAMLKEVGVIGAAIIVAMIVRQMGDVFPHDPGRPDRHLGHPADSLWCWLRGLRRFSPGQPLFIFLMLIMIPAGDHRAWHR